MCIIRQLINQHTIIDSFPMMALLDKTPDSALPRKPPPAPVPRTRQEDITDPPTDDDDSESSDDYSEESSVASELMILPTTSRPPPPSPRRQVPTSAVMSDKIAQDVFVFKKIAERMPPQSLLHLLRADVLVQVDGPTTTSATTTTTGEGNTGEGKAVIEAQDQTEKEVRSEDEREPHQVLAPYRATKVRFAQNEQGKLLRLVRLIEPVRDKSLWWNRDEMDRIRNECITIVEHYTLYKKEFERDVTDLMEDANDANLEDYDQEEMKFFHNHEEARGLERHIVQEFESVKQLHFEAIMDAQHEYKERRATERWKYIKKVSLAGSLPTRYVAVRFAQYDQDIMRVEYAAFLAATTATRKVRTKIPITKAPAKLQEAAPPALPHPDHSPRKSPPPRRNLREFIKRTVSRRFSGAGL